MQGEEKSITAKILDVFSDGPGMVDDLVIELGISSRRISGTLNYLVRTNKLVRRPFHVPPEIKRSGRDEVYLYSLRNYRDAA